MKANSIICIVGLGYVGYPEAVTLSKYFKVIGYDIDSSKIQTLNQANTITNLYMTNNPEDIAKADFVIISVPTPVDEFKTPDLSFVESASDTVGKYMKENAIVILESTVYPEVTEEIMVPILERESGYKCGVDFKVAYSPERINPGDSQHDIRKVTKVVSGMDKETTDQVCRLYDFVALNTFKAKNIKTAEAVKVTENVQRDMNIALINELSFVFKPMGIDVGDVVDAASTKWNFYKCYPGMVGGHCIPVDPYYLTYKSEKLGYSPKLIHEGRAVNDSMPKRVADMVIAALHNREARILIAGLTYKEDVDDIRESPAKYLVKELEPYGVNMVGYDPLLENIEGKFNIGLINDLFHLKDIDCIIFTVAHRVFKDIGLSNFRSITTDNPVLVDVKGCFERSEAVGLGFKYLTL